MPSDLETAASSGLDAEDGQQKHLVSVFFQSFRAFSIVRAKQINLVRRVNENTCDLSFKSLT
jgi:hypothetical protein